MSQSSLLVILTATRFITWPNIWRFCSEGKQTIFLRRDECSLHNKVFMCTFESVLELLIEFQFYAQLLICTYYLLFCLLWSYHIHIAFSDNVTKIGGLMAKDEDVVKFVHIFSIVHLVSIFMMKLKTITLKT